MNSNIHKLVESYPRSSCSHEHIPLLTSLEALPCEIMWTIIEFTPESVLDLRLVSRQIKSFVDTLTMLPAGTIFAEELIVVGTNQHQSKRNYRLSPMTIDIRVAKCKRRIFELRLSLCQFPFGFMSRIHRGVRKVGFGNVCDGLEVS
ncbi:hypothetical protein PENTCL1PPCAC_8132, partial [Pristionchus entomophagus]